MAGPTGTLTKNVVIGGKSNSQSVSLTGATALVKEVSVAAALDGTVAVMTSGSVGTLTIPGNTIVTGARIDLYWSGGQRHGVVVGTVAGSSVPITGGTGTNLPAVSTAIQAAVATAIPLQLDAAHLLMLSLYSEAYGTFTLVSSVPADNFQTAVFPQGAAVNPAANTYSWSYGNGEQNPLAATVSVTIYMTHNDSSGAKTMRLCALLDN